MQVVFFGRAGCSGAARVHAVPAGAEAPRPDEGARGAALLLLVRAQAFRENQQESSSHLCFEQKYRRLQ